MLIYFIFYFLGGYLLYSAIYAAIGAAVDSETDTQQFMPIVMMPLVLAVYVGLVAVIARYLKIRQHCLRKLGIDQCGLEPG